MPTHTSQKKSRTRKKVSHGGVAKLRYIFSYLAVAFEGSPAQGDNKLR
jgi:hypothetical protein